MSSALTKFAMGLTFFWGLRSFAEPIHNLPPDGEGGYLTRMVDPISLKIHKDVPLELARIVREAIINVNRLRSYDKSNPQVVFRIDSSRLLENNNIPLEDGKNGVYFRTNLNKTSEEETAEMDAYWDEARMVISEVDIVVNKNKIDLQRHPARIQMAIESLLLDLSLDHRISGR
ncbi:MAG: hypothetical protein RJB66_696 [Pseudomonadota bacterium]